MIKFRKFKKTNRKIKDWWYDFQHWWSFTKCHDICYKFKCRFWYKYNTVEAKTLPRTYVNPSELLPHIMFQILVDFIEQEKPYETFDTEDSNDAKEWTELKALYDWWKKNHNYDSMYDYDTIKHTSFEDRWERSSDGFVTLKDYETQEEKDWWKEVWRREEEFYKTLEKNLKRLVELRKMLWT